MDIGTWRERLNQPWMRMRMIGNQEAKLNGSINSSRKRNIRKKSRKSMNRKRVQTKN